jgi:Tfp pilus assembly protein PilF
MAINPTDGHVWQRTGRAYIAFGKADDAFKYIAAASKYSPELGPPELGMATAWSAKGDAIKTREWFGKAVLKHPDSFQVHLEYANWLLQQKDLVEAKVQAEMATRLKPASAEMRRLKMQIADAERPK